MKRPRSKDDQNPKKKQKLESDKLSELSPYAKYETQQFTKKFTPYNYIDHFLNNYSHLIKLFPYKKTKEISESMSAYECLYRVINVDRSCRNTVCYVLGDGTTPRTGALLAASSAFTVYSIDPVMKMKYDNYTERLSCFKCKAEDFKNIHNEITNDNLDYEPKLDESLKLSIIIGVHSHADLLSFWSRVPHTKIAIAIPCCVPQITDIDPTGTYIDRLNVGKCNTVKYWDTRDK